MVRVVLGKELTPSEHEALIIDRVQELADLEGQMGASRLVADLAVDVPAPRANMT